MSEHSDTPQQIYGERYYENYRSGSGLPYSRIPAWLNFFGSVADHVVKDIGPRTVLDVGCAKGFLVEALRDRGVDAYGLDVSEYAIGQARDDIRGFCSSMLSSSCSNRADVRAKATPAAAKFAVTYPAPSPSSSRPPERRSIVAAVLAVSTGFRSALSSTRVPTRIRSVTPATAATAASGSHWGTTTWSVNVTTENPSVS